MKKNYYWLPLSGVVLTLLIYWPTFNGYFLGEDYAWWAYVKGKSFFEVLRYFFVSPSQTLAGWYHPLVGLLYWLNVNLFGMNPLGFHLTNLLIHLGVYLLVVALAFFFFKKVWPSILAGFLFLIFPFHSEAVAWIDGRHDLLVTLFYLLSFYLFLRWIEKGKKVLLVFSILSFFLSLAAKETAVTLPLALMVYLGMCYCGILRCQANQHRVLDKLKHTVWYWEVLGGYLVVHGVYVGHFNPFRGASHVSTIVSRVLVLYLLVLTVSFAFFLLVRKSKVWDEKGLKLILLLAILIGVFYLPAAFTFTQERYLYLPSTMASIFLANLVFLFWSYGAKAPPRRGDGAEKRSEKKDGKIGEFGLIRVILIFVLILASVVSVKYLTNRVYDWKKASDIAQRVVSEFKNYSREIAEDSTLYFANLPDNYHGSYIFRTHTAEAMRSGSGKNFKKIVVLPRTLGIGESDVKNVDQKNFELKSEDGYLIFEPQISEVLPTGEKVLETEDYRLLIKNQNLLELTLKKDYLGEDKVYFFAYQEERIKVINKIRAD